MQLQRQTYGANWLLHVSGTPSEVGTFLNTLFNFGVISFMPQVTIHGRGKNRKAFATGKSGRKRFLKGALAMADAELIRERANVPLLKLRNCRERVFRAARWAKQFVPVTASEAMGRKANGARINDYDLTPEEKRDTARLRELIFG